VTVSPAARTLLVGVGLCLLVTACRAPGEPPAHPDVGVYRDIIRREADSTHTALATARVVIATAQTQGLPGTYARVTLRTAVGDLDHVSTDLGEIDPPPASIRPQARLRSIARQDATLIGRLQHHWSDHALRARTLRQVTRDADELDGSLDDQLQR
jgi:hypothetical protein